MTNSQGGAVGAPIIIGGLALLLLIVGGGYYVISNQSGVGQRALMEDKNVVQDGMSSMENGGESMAEEVVREKAGGSVYSGQVLAGNAAPLLVYNKVDYERAVSEGKLVVLYFYANWCPICRAEFPLMEAVFNELTSDQVIGFRVNYNDNETDDDEEAVARKFGVPYQHTKVFVRGGEQLLKSPEQWTTQRYLDEINSRI